MKFSSSFASVCSNHANAWQNRLDLRPVLSCNRLMVTVIIIDLSHNPVDNASNEPLFSQAGQQFGPPCLYLLFPYFLSVPLLYTA